MKKKVVLLFVLAMTATSVFGACSPKADNGKETQGIQTEHQVESESKEETKEAETAKEETDSSESHNAQIVSDGTVTVTDMNGREVTLPENIESIATFGSIGVINAFVELMGEGDKICNQMTANFTKSDKWKMQYEFAPQIKDAPLFQNADGEILIEEVLKVKPDLCLVMSKDLIEPLESSGLNVVYFEWKQTEDVKTAVTLMGDALGKQDIAEDYIKFFDETVASVEELTKDLEEGDKKKVIYGNIEKFNQPHVIAEWWIAAAGGISVTDDGRTSGDSYEYTIEDLLLWNPEVMFVMDQAAMEEIKSDSKLAEITAVKEEKIYSVPTVAHVWGNRTVEQPLTVLWAANKIYPDLVTEDMLSEKIAYFYSHFFQYDLSEEQISQMIG